METKFPHTDDAAREMRETIERAKRRQEVRAARRDFFRRSGLSIAILLAILLAGLLAAFC